VVAWSVAFGSASLGSLEFWECFLFDTYVRHRPARSVDPRIAVVTIDEADLLDVTGRRVVNDWPLPDAVVLEIVEIVARQEPRAIGLHLYLPPSNSADRDRLKARIAETTNLIGMDKVVGSGRQAPSVFPREQLAMSDMVLDADATVRRGLVAIYDTAEKSYLSWGAQLAVEYLKAKGIAPERQQNGDVRLGRGLVPKLDRGDGGYGRKIDTGGFQVLMDYRGGLDAFETVSLRDLRAGNFDPDLFRDRIVAIGPTSPQLKRAYRTPVVARPSNRVASLGLTQSFLKPDFGAHSQNGDRSSDVAKIQDGEQLMSSLLIHLNLTSQLLDRALVDRPGLMVVPSWVEWGWVAFCAWLGSQYCLIPDRRRVWRASGTLGSWVSRGGLAIGITGGLLGVGAIAVWLSWWLPTIAPIVAFWVAIVCQSAYRAHLLYRWASYDALTGVGNRGLFDSTLQELQASSAETRQPFAVILCDVDWFKAYNDTYGHQQGDWCLERVARAIASATRPEDMVARYGGEEFVVLLPDTGVEGATALADRLCRTIRDLEIEHRASPVGTHLTLSCGVTVSYPARGDDRNPVADADRALYRAKDRGRDTWEIDLPPREAARCFDRPSRSPSGSQHDRGDDSDARASRTSRSPRDVPPSPEPQGSHPPRSDRTPERD